MVFSEDTPDFSEINVYTLGITNESTYCRAPPCCSEHCNKETSEADLLSNRRVAL